MGRGIQILEKEGGREGGREGEKGEVMATRAGLGSVGSDL